MKTIKIAHLYYDLMNLYGESGNVLALVEAIEAQGLKCKVDNLTKDNIIDFSKYDVFIMGMGTEDNQEIVRKDILKYKSVIKKVIKTKTFIMTGNSYELFGSTLNNLECLNIFDFKSTTNKARIVGEQVYKTTLLDTPIIGFQNRGSINDIKENYLFEIVNGFGNNANINYEGIKVYDFYGTYTIGPLLVRNPQFKDKIVEDLLLKLNCNYKEIKNTPDYIAYNEYLKNFNIKKDN